MSWQAHWRGWSVALIDRLDVQSSSRVAAGLVTPITGSRAAASWRWNDFYPAANLFYAKVEHALGVSFWNIEPALRVHRSESERAAFESKWIDSNLCPNSNSIRAISSSGHGTTGIKIPFGMSSMEPSARLDTAAYLSATQQFFEKRSAFYTFNLNCNSDIVVDSRSAEYPIKIALLQLIGKRIVFCQGMAARENGYFCDLPLHPARGDILVVESPEVHTDRVIHHEAWAVPMGGGRFLVGATYDRLALAGEAEQSIERANRFRDELMRRWESLSEGSFLGGQHVVQEQRWAIRPASYDRHPLIGPHDSIRNVFCLNGMGSKGTLMAPRLAEILIDALDGSVIDPTLLRSRRK